MGIDERNDAVNQPVCLGGERLLTKGGLQYV
jgi:hypothetical protein